MLNIGERIIQLRKAKKWSQDELAKKINSSRIMIGKYERNDNAPSIEVLSKLAKAFKVSLDYLFLGWCLCVVLYSYSRLIDYCLIRFSLVLILEVCSSIGVDWHALDYALV